MTTERQLQKGARSPKMRGFFAGILGKNKTAPAAEQYSQTVARLGEAATRVTEVLDAVTVQIVDVASQAPRKRRFYEIFRGPAHDVRTVPLTAAIGTVQDLSRSLVQAGELSVEAANIFSQAVETDRANQEQALAAKAVQKAAEQDNIRQTIAARRSLEEAKTLKWVAVTEVLVVNPIRAARDKYQAAQARRELYKDELPEERRARKRREKAEKRLTALQDRRELAESPGVDDVLDLEAQRLMGIINDGRSDIPESSGVLRRRATRRSVLRWTVAAVALAIPGVPAATYFYNNHLSSEARAAAAQAAAEAYIQKSKDFEKDNALGVDSQVENENHIVRHPKLDNDLYIQKGQSVIIDAEKNRRPIKGTKVERTYVNQLFGGYWASNEVEDIPSVKFKNFLSQDGQNKVMLLIETSRNPLREMFSGDRSWYEFRFPNNRPDLKQSGLNGEYVEIYNKKTKTSFYIKIDRPESEDPNIFRITYFEKKAA
jgi:hypothetical protein